HIPSFVDADATRVVIHAESGAESARAIALARRLNVEVGLALNPATAVREVASLLALVDSVLLLTVEPGYYGSRFLPDVLPKVAEVRALRGDIAIGVDGGIKGENIRQVARFGVDDICVGSAIFRDPAPAEAYRRLQQLVTDA
ncbi:MAG: ribulose-phosphate 3-epimerase, partial [Chloroflexota bacterium]